MHALHESIAGLLGKQLKAERVVVWYDRKPEFEPFVEELLRDASGDGAQVEVGGVRARIFRFAGSYFALRAQVEPFVSVDEPEPVLLYVPGREHDALLSPLMELEKAGTLYQVPLRQIARGVLRKTFTEDKIDQLLAPEGVAYRDLVRALGSKESGAPGSLLRVVFHRASTPQATLAEWLSEAGSDAAIIDKGAEAELAAMLRARLDFEAPAGTSLAKLRAKVARHVLGSEFREDLGGEAPASLASLPRPRTQEQRDAVSRLAAHLRAQHKKAYEALADQVEQELGLGSAELPAERLGSIDTFRFEERALLAHCARRVGAGDFAGARAVIVERKESFWVESSPQRWAEWEAFRHMVELGLVTDEVRGELKKKAPQGASAWVARYCAEEGGWWRLDTQHRRLEAMLATLDEEPDERALARVRGAYEEVCEQMARGFAQALEGAGWEVRDGLHQTDVFRDVVQPGPQPVAYFLVDAMRYEMAVELQGVLPAKAERSLRPAIAALPTITPVGMAALMPGASSSFAVVEQKGKLGAQVDGVFLADLAARKKHLAAAVPGSVDLSLDELLTKKKSELKKKLEGARVVVVRSQEIDAAGENAASLQARRAMAGTVGDLVRAMVRLTQQGVTRFVLTADHGHLFHASERDESQRIDAPGGQTVDLHRRCWVGRGGATPAGCVRVSGQQLGYATDLDFVFPQGTGVFRAGGDLSYHHGGLSLQEAVIPVLTVRLETTVDAPSKKKVSVSGAPEVITNRIFSVSLTLDEGELPLEATAVRPVLVAGARVVGVAGMVAGGGTLDATTGHVALESGKTASVGFLLRDDTAEKIRILVQDPNTDAELYRSPADIPVKLGV